MQVCTAVVGDLWHACCGLTNSPHALVLLNAWLLPPDAVCRCLASSAAVCLAPPAVIKVEEAVLEFIADSSRATLEFEPNNSNYEVWCGRGGVWGPRWPR